MEIITILRTVLKLIEKDRFDELLDYYRFVGTLLERNDSALTAELKASDDQLAAAVAANQPKEGA